MRGRMSSSHHVRNESRSAATTMEIPKMRPRTFLWPGGGGATGIDLRCNFGAVVAGLVAPAAGVVEPAAVGAALFAAGVGFCGALSWCECSCGVVIGERTPATVQACM